VGIKKRLAILLCTIMMISLILGAITPAFAKSTREAKIESVVGEVEVTKAGGSKSYSAFEGMTLNQGDHIQTGPGSKVVLIIVDHDDEVTIDQNSSVYISELSESAKGKKSKVKMWAGSLWGKVKTLAGTDDEFEVETPTAVMGVRGTNLLVGVDPETGESKFYIASGVGQVNKKGEEDSGGGTTLNPNEQISMDEDTSNLEDNKSVADLNDLITNTSDAIIEAIVKSKAAIDEENEQYINNLQNQTGGLNQDTIDRINQNLDNLVGNIVKNAITQNKVDETKITELIEQINQQLDKKLDLDTVKAQELSDAEKAKQAQVKLLEEERKKKQEEEKKKQEELKKQNEALQQKLKEQLEKQKAEKQKAEEASKKKAAEEHEKKLADDVARAAFAAKQKAIEEEKAKQAAIVAAAIAAEEARLRVIADAAEAARLKAIADAAAAEAANQPAPVLIPKVTTEIVQGSPRASLNVYLQDFGTKGIYGVQLHFTHSSDIYAHGIVNLESDIFTDNDPEFVYLLKDSSYYDASENYMTETMFIITKYDTTNLTVTSKQLLASIDFSAYSSGSITLQKVIIVDKTGASHTIQFNQTPIQIEQNINPE